MSRFLILMVCMCLPAIAHCDFVTFEFTGTVPEGASSHSMVDDGESFVATFTVDNTVPDSEQEDPTVGIYDLAVVSNSIEFSNGYSVSFEGLGQLVVGDNFDGILDAVQVGTLGQGQDGTLFVQRTILST